MEDCVKTYRMELVTKSPIFIGEGRKLNKKEYIRKGSKIYVPDLQKMVQDLSEKGLVSAYEEYMLRSDEDLERWLAKNRVSVEESKRWTMYTLDCGDVSLERKKPLELELFVKDAYGCPYVSGSSLKGALRTVILAYILKTEQTNYEENKREIARESKYSHEKRKNLLQKQTRQLEVKAFHRLGKKAERPADIQNAVNDIMSGLRISDSKPIAVENLAICQKIDMTKEGKENPINIVRECIRPDTKIEFDLTLDESFPYSIEELREAIKMFANSYFNCFYKFFYKSNSDLNVPRVNYIWLGGGVGYVSKTVVYNLFGWQEGLHTTAEIMQKTVKESKHGHRDDVRRGVSPHMLKCTRYRGKLYEFGQCAVKIV